MGMENAFLMLPNLLYTNMNSHDGDLVIADLQNVKSSASLDMYFLNLLFSDKTVRRLDPAKVSMSVWINGGIEEFCQIKKSPFLRQMISVSVFVQAFVNMSPTASYNGWLVLLQTFNFAHTFGV